MVTESPEMENFLEILFSASPEQIAANMAEAARIAAVEAASKEADAKRIAEAAAAKIAARCPRCMGAGFLSQFQYFKGGECFACGGSGVFSRN